ncbi:MAG: bifunctional 5,10-methylenetetrahydrofolate dehydrogenase/5,10-methenyltetrahydrofolate cyclohydrolase [Candidatus Eremiobacteraeota bacterium]|nr:bifunctional 5,10-methylenetetrahydrofolate dehydrogenase/5,10-methenyltetrahydrofolate cyclohydrolase [Candidatus Eremiobacteraeota bacterium]MBV8281901.1 bifunctional 5,10-methylenetetrahydrofolate dehydrogenase/5,10-methenyltetrahydrofolate cyclohydrolase [Candidatus Eremiobacteraeota bacterium]
MPARILEGKPIAQRIRADVANRAYELRDNAIVPQLSIFVGEGDEEGTYYANSLNKIGSRCGIDVSIDTIARGGGTKAFCAAVARAAANHKVHGIIIQRPLPTEFEHIEITRAIPVEKDVDGETALSIGWLAQGVPHFVPATAAAVIEVLREPGLPQIAGARTVVIGRSAVVGRPVAYMLTAADATVTLCHSRTRDLEMICRSADIVVAAIGKPRFVGAGMIKRGSVVVDVGTNLIDGQVVGDVDAESVSQIAGALTPVPGGVGVVTTSILLRNVIAAAEHGTI